MDGDVALVVAVEQLDLERVVELSVEPGRQVGHQAGHDGELVEQVKVGRVLAVAVQRGEACGDGGALVFQLGEPGQDA